MKKYILILIVSCLGISNSLSAKQKDPVKGFAVVELFTSEGCSSCPPADELVARFQRENAGKSLYILAYHVDYWDKLGWKDVFSNASYSRRQYQYSDWLNLHTVYTPQVIVNGKKEFVGSDERSLRSSVQTSLQQSGSARLNLEGLKIVYDKVNLQYTAEGATGNDRLVVALVQKSASTQVKRGENGGHTLNHVQIVRNLQTIMIDGKNMGACGIDIPKGLDQSGLEVVAFLQNNNTGEIRAAARKAL